MRKLRAALGVAAAIGALAVAGVAGAANIGVNEDETKTDTSLYAGMADVGLKQNVLSVIWTQGAGLSAGQQSVIKSATSAAAARGIKIVLAIYASNAPGNPAKFADPANSGEFVAFVKNAVTALRSANIDTVIIGNEPNRKNFMSPPKPDLYGQILADSYDAVKSVDPGIAVVGVAVSPRGDNKGNMWPTDFVKQLGDWYRASGRTAPLMDGFSIHPYPDPEDRAPNTPSDWPQVNMADLYRIKQAISDGFSGTPQKTVEGGLPLHIDEIAFQVPTEGKPGYTGAEPTSVSLVGEDKQADFYTQLVTMAACDPQITSLNFFHFIDESNRTGFQSGLLDVSKNQRPVYAAVKSALAATNGGSKCNGTPVSWQPSTGVIGFKADLSGVKPAYSKTVSSIVVKVRVEEDANVKVSLLDSGGKPVAEASKKNQTAHSSSNTGASADIKLPLSNIKEGSYTLQVEAVSVLNDKRSSTATSDKFAIGSTTSPADDSTSKIDLPSGKKSKCRKLPAGVASGRCNSKGKLTRIIACKPDRVNHNRDLTDGCEVNLLTSVNHCGSIGKKVPTGYVCRNGVARKP